MGQSKQAIHRSSESSSRKFLSPTTGTFIGPNGARKDGHSKASRTVNVNYTTFIRALPYAVAIFGVAFIASCITASIMTPVQNSDALQQVALTFDDSGYYANVSSSGIVNLDLIGTIDGATAIAHDTVTTTTNSVTGYKLYISSASSTTGANSLNGSGTAAGYSLSAATGTLETPATLSTNTWGYTTTSVTGNSTTITETSNFIGMPLMHSENLLQTYNQAATSGNSLEVYYGVKANTALPSGIYTSNVVYTVVAEGSPASEGKVALDQVATTSLTGGETITISTGLYTSATNIGTPAVTIGGDVCTDVASTITSSGAIRLTCTTPAKTNYGDYDVAVSIPKFEKNYVLEKGYHYYKPWSEMTKMQEMTSYACSLVPTPSVYLADGTTINADVPEKTLTDVRDGETYKVRKLADGNCWMIGYLQIMDQTIFAADSNFETGSFTLPAHSNNVNLTVSAEPGIYKDANAMPFYNGIAAAAGTSSDNTGTYTQDICPKNWHVHSGAQFENLLSAYEIDGTEVASYYTMTSAPFDYMSTGWINWETDHYRLIDYSLNHISTRTNTLGIVFMRTNWTTTVYFRTASIDWNDPAPIRCIAW